ncbi:MAG: biosynthetic-type acetolactate synthase large subunit [Lentisphaeria bacterium]
MPENKPANRIQKDAEILGSEQLVRCLEQEKTEYIFAYPGGTSMAVHQALLNSSIKVVLPRHEQGGGFAANGYARKSGRAGVCLVTSGPGATNLVTAIADAYMDSIPMVFLTCQVDQHLIGKNAFQETDVIGMTRPFVKHSYLVFKADEIAQVIKDAFFLATNNRPGPIVVDIPCDVLSEKCEPRIARFPSLKDYDFIPVVSDIEIQAVLNLLKCSKRPCIYAGGGVIHSGTSELLKKFADVYHIPVTTTLMGIGAFPENHPLSLKMVGMHGSYAANRAIHECDLLLGICVRFSDRVTGDIEHFAPKAKIVHVDIDLSEINKNKHADLAVVCSVKTFFEKLLDRSQKLDTDPWLKQVAQWKKEYPFLVPESDNNVIQPQKVVQVVYELTRGKATIVTGVGQHQMWAAQLYNFYHPRQLLTSGGLGAMGFGLPAAIGAQLAAPKEQVVLLDGDGSFQMNIQELATVFSENLPLKMILFNNQCLGMVSQWETRFKNGRHANTDLRIKRAGRPYPDFCMIAKGYMIPGREVYKKDELIDAVQWMLNLTGPALLDVHVDKDAEVLPMIPPGKTSKDIILK